jgi:hypothetical protein
MNGVPISTAQLSDTIHVRSRYFGHETRSLNLSETSAMKDKTQECSDLFLSVNNPLGIFGDSGLFAGETRVVISHCNVIANTTTNVQLDM